MAHPSHKTIIVIGAGPAGMMAAIKASEAGASVTLLERNERVGRKLGITGKGRCNVTNACEAEDFFKNVVSNPRFLYSAFYRFSNQDVMEFFESNQVPLVTERGNRVFPASQKARDVVDALYRALKKSGVTLISGTRVTEIYLEEMTDSPECISRDATANGKNDNSFRWRVRAGEKVYRADAVILATGGKSYPLTGSTGDGYHLAQQLGHEVTALRPALSGLNTREKWTEFLAGLSLRNVNVTLYRGEHVIYQEFGEMLFTHTGVSGPVILSASSFLCADLQKKKAENIPEDVILSIDLKPALTLPVLDERLLRDLNQYAQKIMLHAAKDLLPERMIPVILAQAGINPGKRAGAISKEERIAMARALKNLTLHVSGFRPMDEAIVTSGGIDVREVNPHTMESKRTGGLYFAGEILDTDALTGGFNLQQAFSTGALAGISAAKE